MAKKAPVAAPGQIRRYPKVAVVELAHISEGLRPLAVPIAKLLPDPANARRHPDRNMESIKASLARYGQRKPVVANRTTGIIEAGNATWEAARALGWTYLAVVYVEDDSTMAAGYAIADNRTAELAEWNDQGLARILEALKTEGELPNVGFSEADLDELLRSLQPPKEETFNVAKALAAAPELAERVKPGQVWKLGKHRLMCGDAMKPQDVAGLMGGDLGSLFATDPPYLVDYTGADRPDNSGKDWSRLYQEVHVKDARGFFDGAFRNAVEALKEDAAWYVWHAHKRAAVIEAVWADLGILNHQQIVWVKPTAVHTYSFWPWQHEPCLMGWKSGHKPQHDGDNSHAITTVWQFGWDGSARVIGNQHPTQKPTELWEIPIRKHTGSDEIVLDLFVGSGTAVMAAERTGRRCYGMDLSPIFCAVAIARWESYTGESAVLDA